jgi:hypothetical protein
MKQMLVMNQPTAVYGLLPFCKHFTPSSYWFDCTRIFGLLMGSMALAIMGYSRVCS